MSAMVKFACRQCKAGLKARAEKAGRWSRCPVCQTKVSVPMPCVPVVIPLPPQESTTPLDLTLPNGLGGIKANVSQETANTITKTFIGGLLVALGVVLMAMLGVKSRST